jgi:hypothetical protein
MVHYRLSTASEMWPWSTTAKFRLSHTFRHLGLPLGAGDGQRPAGLPVMPKGTRVHGLDDGLDEPGLGVVDVTGHSDPGRNLGSGDDLVDVCSDGFGRDGGRETR